MSGNGPDGGKPARIVGLAGPLGGIDYLVDPSGLTIGRESTNHVEVPDLAVSRRHCLVIYDGVQYVLRDLGSVNGTYLNNIRVCPEAPLHDGDRIFVGDSVLLFRWPDTIAAISPPCIEWDTDSCSTETLKLSPGDTAYRNLRTADAAFDAERAIRDLRTMVEFATAVNALSVTEQIESTVLCAVMGAVPAESVALLRVSPSTGEIRANIALDKSNRQPQTLTVSRTLVERVLAERVGILLDRSHPSWADGSSSSLAASLAQALLVVPLIAQGRTLGVLYAETTLSSNRFDEGHLHWLVAVASIAALALDTAQALNWLRNENLQLRQECTLQHNIVGESKPMIEFYELLGRVAPSDSTVLIGGETGTGKELAARAIHSNSSRATKPFIAINCAVLNEQLLESELFGHERGAFTGAVNQKKGKLEVAHGGTVFLDEIGELALSVQAKLLRVLQEKEFERVGGTRPIPTDIRLIAATNRDLQKEVNEGRFRSDLYYRLKVLTLRMPPLRERIDDVPLLASFFANRCAQRCRRRVAGLSDEARSVLMSYSWPGNVRELENVIERAMVMGSTELILPEDLPEELLEVEPEVNVASQAGGYHAGVKAAKQAIVADALDRAGGSYTVAAKFLGLHPNNLHRVIRNLGLNRSSSSPKDS